MRNWAGRDSLESLRPFVVGLFCKGNSKASEPEAEEEEEEEEEEAMKRAVRSRNKKKMTPSMDSRTIED